MGSYSQAFEKWASDQQRFYGVTGRTAYRVVVYSDAKKYATSLTANKKAALLNSG